MLTLILGDLGLDGELFLEPDRLLGDLVDFSKPALVPAVAPFLVPPSPFVGDLDASFGDFDFRSLSRPLVGDFTFFLSLSPSSCLSCSTFQAFSDLWPTKLSVM